ncbi:MHYT domain-containing protein [Caenimonas sp. SL110]|uniref:MHYT domain-containing protein n=1 Tax=Caenimonas sp. SL110 TaxID=1450524 RepID=UPI000A660C60|nr:MHYT domain-containing protein [Caenimonas sp. SL110]
MNLVITPEYAPGMVVLSFVIAAAGAFAALTASSLIVGRNGRVQVINALTAGVALGGIGVWSMHFIGMLAVHIDMGVSYSIPETLLSLVAAVAGSTAALWWVALRPSLPRVVGAGVLLGFGVVVMHYLGMYGMRFGGRFEWSVGTVALSVVIAIVAAIAALWLAFVVRTLVARIGASLAMAGTVCAMHYTGMAAATFICTTPNPQAFPAGPLLVNSLQMPVLVSIVAFGAVFVILVDQAFQRLQAQPRRAAPAGR